MNCLKCSKRPVKYAKLKLCNTCYTRQKRATPHATYLEPDATKEPSATTDATFVPNWQRNGYKSKEEAMIHAIALIVKNQPTETISWGGKIWDIKSFSKKFLSQVKTLI